MTSAPPLAASPRPESERSPDDRFTRWVRDSGFCRTDGWVGGVCAGLAARWGVDPVIVRGIAVVATVIGLPALLVYALAWAVLPDGEGRSHAVDLERGHFSYAQGAILVTALGGAVHVLGLFVLLAALLTGSGSETVLVVVIGAIVVATAIVAAGGIALLLRFARRNAGAAADEAQSPTSGAGAPTGATDAAPPAIPTVPSSGTGLAVDHVGAEPAFPAPGEDGAPGDMDAWRAQHAAWKERDRAWRREQDDAERAARAIAREERRAAASVFAREAAARRRARRLSRPRASAAFASLSLGAAVVAGVIAALMSPERLAVAAGMFVAAAIVAAAMIIAGAIRRRSGFLAFVTVCALVGAGAAVAVPTAEDMNIGDRVISNGATASSGTFAQFWGRLDIWLDAVDDARPLIVEKKHGTTSVIVTPGVELTLRATVGRDAALVLFENGDAISLRDLPDAVPLEDGRILVDTTIAADGDPTARQSLTLDQESGYIEIRRLGTTAELQREEIMP